MEFNFTSIEEKDADFAIINSFVTSEEVRQLFFKQIGRGGQVLKAFHSYTDKEKDGNCGESDIIFVCEDEQGKYAVFIEDKINANQQKRQRERYNERAVPFMKKEDCSKPYIFLCAPQAYLDAHKDDGYTNTVSHECIRDLLPDGDMHKEIFNCSIEKKVNTYNPIRDDIISNFWKELAIKHVKSNYPNLELFYTNKNKPSRSFWPEFKTYLDGIKIYWKIEKNCIDLEISRKCKLLNEPSFCFQLGKLLSKNVVFVDVKKNKSVSVRYNLSLEQCILFDKPFEEQEANIKSALDIVQMFSSFCNDIRIEKYIINK